MADSSRHQAIAIVGMSGRFPGAPGLDGFWRTIREGVEVIERFDDADLDEARVDAQLRTNPRYVRQGTPLEGVDQFDAPFFAVSPREAQILDPQHRVFLECAWEALEHAGQAAGSPDRSVGVFAGAGMNTYFITQILSNPALIASAGGYQLMLGNDKDFLATRVSYKLDLRGPSLTVQTACSTSLVAVVLACRALSAGECDLALAGGVSILFPQRAGYLFEEGMILSPDGHCRPFDEQARGTRSAAGAGVVVLKKLSRAIEDRDTIHAVILGSAINNDGAAKAGYTAPSVEGQVEVVATAQALAGVDPRSIEYVETHGTGTQLGDPIEIAALTQAFRASTRDVGFCRIGSLKANLGHLDVAAGVASLIKAVLVLRNRELPPLVNFRSPNPALSLTTSPFAASAERAPWVARGDAKRRAGVSSFGIGGTNAHLVLEEAPAAPAPAADGAAHLLVLSAKTPAALDRTTANLVAHLQANPGESLANVAWTLGVGRASFAHRRAVVVRDATEAIALLGQPGRPPVMAGSYEGGARPVAFLFSGQGSQYAGMGAGLYRDEPVFREAVDRCAAILEPHLGLDVREPMFAAKGDVAVNETRLTQPALFAVEYALASLWMSWGVTPAAMIGHSVGEYLAAHLAGVLSLDDALRVVAARGRLMQAQPAGTMAAISLPASEVERELPAGVEIAALNAPSLTGVSGPAAAVQQLVEKLRSRDVECRELHTSHAFHSAMMEGALAPFVAVLEGVPLAAPRIPYVSNVTGTWITKEQATSPAYYAEHLRRAVRFEAGVRAMAADPAAVLLEVGPGSALASLARLTLGKDGAKRVWSSLPHPREDKPDLGAALEAAGRLWLAGVAIDWKAFQARPGVRRVPLPTYPFDRKRYWVDPPPQAPSIAATPPEGPRWSPSPEDWLYAPTWTRDDSLGSTAPRLQNAWLVLGAPGALRDALARHLKAASATPVLVEAADRFERAESTRFLVRAGSDEDIAKVVHALRDAGFAVDGAIHLTGAAGTRDYHALVALGAALDPSFGGRRARILAATYGAESVLDEPVRQPEGAMVIGPVLVLPTEVPGLQLRAVDVGALDGASAIEAAARHLLAEAGSGDGEALVAWRLGRRWVRRLEPIALPEADPSSLPLKRRGVYLVTGGLGGIGLTLSKWLARGYAARLLLTGRSGLHERAVGAIREIEAAGGEVIVAAAGASDEAAMRGAIGEAQARWGAIDGVIHAAGVPGNGGIAFRKTAQDVDGVLDPKVAGLDVLVRLLGGAPLDFVALFSSVNALLGAPGCCDYASANAVLDAFVDSERRPKGWARVVAFDWGPWRDVGMAANVVVAEGFRKEREASLRRAISPEGGAEAFARVLASGRRRVLVTPFDPNQVGAPRASATAQAAATAAPQAAAEPQARPSLSSAYEAPQTDVERRMVEIWTELLGLERVGVHDNFFELGGHSLLATRVLARIDVTLKARLTLRDIFDAPTVHGLSAKVAKAAAAASTAPSPGEEREEIEF